jgi:hypothetical protein
VSQLEELAERLSHIELALERIEKKLGTAPAPKRDPASTASASLVIRSTANLDGSAVDVFGFGKDVVL